MMHMPPSSSSGGHGHSSNSSKSPVPTEGTHRAHHYTEEEWKKITVCVLCAA